MYIYMRENRFQCINLTHKYKSRQSPSVMLRFIVRLVVCNVQIFWIFSIFVKFETKNKNKYAEIE